MRKKEKTRDRKRLRENLRRNKTVLNHEIERKHRILTLRAGG